MRSSSRISSSTSALFFGSSYFTLTHKSLSSGCRVVEGLQREEHHVVGGVLAPAEGLLPLVQHANHGVEPRLDATSLPTAGSSPKSSSQVSCPRTTTCAARCLPRRCTSGPAASSNRSRPTARRSSPCRIVPATFLPLYFTLDVAHAKLETSRGAVHRPPPPRAAACAAPSRRRW